MRFDDVFVDLLQIVSDAGARPDVPLDAQEFFTKEAAAFSGTKAEFIEFVRSRLPLWFKHLGRTPNWIQDPEWQYSRGKPMVFVGQIDVPASAGVFHDEASFYVFWSPDTGERKTVIQVA